jgi:hypothetical protein
MILQAGRISRPESRPQDMTKVRNPPARGMDG